MVTSINLYVNKDYKPYFDQIVACANMNKENVSTLIGKAMKYYQEDLNGHVPLIADRKDWKKMIKNMTSEDAIEMNRLICDLNGMILEKCKVPK